MEDKRFPTPSSADAFPVLVLVRAILVYLADWDQINKMASRKRSRQDRHIRNISALVVEIPRLTAPLYRSSSTGGANQLGALSMAMEPLGIAPLAHACLKE